jgi:hypothetical protein
VRHDTRPPRRHQDCICNDKDFAAKIGEVSATNDIFVELRDIAIDTKAKPNTLTVHQRNIRIMPMSFDARQRCQQRHDLGARLAEPRYAHMGAPRPLFMAIDAPLQTPWTSFHLQTHAAGQTSQRRLKASLRTQRHPH